MTQPPRHYFSRILLLGMAMLFSWRGGRESSASFLASAFLPNYYSTVQSIDCTSASSSTADPRRRIQRQRQPSCHHSLSSIQQLRIIHTQSTLRNRNTSFTVTTTTSSSSLHSFFGLGPAELAIVAVASLLVIGPSNLLNFSKEAGNIAGKTAASMGEEWNGEKLKNIPEEFRKGVEMGEIEARSRKAKVMTNVEKDDTDDE